MSNQKLVFIVDDDSGMLRGLRRLLREHGYDSTLFQSAEAFESCNEFGDGICVVLDIQLNGRSGIELRHRLTGISLPVIYMTGNDSESI